MEIQELVPTIQTYEANLAKARSQIANVFLSYFSIENPKALLSFWINFSSQGVGMTEPVESWIRRAGRKCEELGFNELGKQLVKHAIHEANHHLLMIKDTYRLVNEWNTLYTPVLNAEDLLQRPLIPEVIAYRELHEVYITGEVPYCQVAIEYEIENLGAVYGSKMVNHSLQVLGKSFKESISFLDEHAQVDIAHTQFNRKAISNFIDEHSVVVNDLIKAGEKALRCYGDFLAACLKPNQLL